MKPSSFLHAHHCNALASQLGPGFSSNNAGDGPWADIQMHKVYPTLPKYNAKDFADFELMLTTSLPKPLSLLLGGKVPTPTEAARVVPMSAKQVKEYTTGYDEHNRCLYQALLHCCSADIEIRALILSPVHSQETKGLEAWKAVLLKHTDVSNITKLSTIHKLLSLKQKEDETPELYMLREQTLFQLVQSQNINLIDLRQSLFLSGLKPKYRQLIDTLLLTGTTMTIASIVDACKESDLRSSNLSRDHTMSNARGNSAKGKGKGRNSGGDTTKKGGVGEKGGDMDLKQTIEKMVQKQFKALAAFPKEQHGSRLSGGRSNGKPRVHFQRGGKRESPGKGNSKEMHCKHHPNSTTHTTSECYVTKNEKSGGANGRSHYQDPASRNRDPNKRVFKGKGSRTIDKFRGRSNVARAMASDASLTISDTHTNSVDVLVDSGASHHMLSVVPNQSCKVFPDNTEIQTASGRLTTLGRSSFGPLKNFLVVPDISENLMSVSKKVNEGYTVVFNDKGVNFYKAGTLPNFSHVVPSLHGVQKDGMFLLKLNQTSALYSGVPPTNFVRALSVKSITDTPPLYTAAMLTSIQHPNLYTLWHNRLGHQRDAVLEALRKKPDTPGIVNGGITFTPANKAKHLSQICDGCAEGKQTDAPIKRRARKRRHESSITQANELAPDSSDLALNKYAPGQLVYMDILFSGVMALHGLFTMALIMLDACSRKLWVYGMAHKDEAPSNVAKWAAWMKANGKEPSGFSTIRSDNDSVFTGSEMTTVLNKFGIKREHCAPYGHVPAVERSIRTAKDRTRTMLHMWKSPLSL